GVDSREILDLGGLPYGSCGVLKSCSNEIAVERAIRVALPGIKNRVLHVGHLLPLHRAKASFVEKLIALHSSLAEGRASCLAVSPSKGFPGPYSGTAFPWSPRPGSRESRKTRRINTG